MSRLTRHTKHDDVVRVGSTRTEQMPSCLAMTLTIKKSRPGNFRLELWFFIADSGAVILINSTVQLDSDWLIDFLPVAFPCSDSTGTGLRLMNSQLLTPEQNIVRRSLLTWHHKTWNWSRIIMNPAYPHRHVWDETPWQHLVFNAAIIIGVKGHWCCSYSFYKITTVSFENTME